MRVFVSPPLPAVRVTAAFIVGSGCRRRISRMRLKGARSGWAGQVRRILRGRTGLRRAVDWRKRLSIRAKHLGRVLSLVAAPNRVRRNKGLRLSRHRSENAVLVESDTVRAAAVVRILKARAANLGYRVSESFRYIETENALPSQSHRTPCTEPDPE
jgi:hypothetical protein